MEADMERDYVTGSIITAGAEEARSAVSWSAIFAGATASLAAAFVMLALAGGLGLKLGSPWPGPNLSSDDFNPTLGAILVAIQVLSAGLGGYLAGRLRTKWVNVHSHEVHFRDTAHGLVVWAVSTVAGVLLALTVMAPVAGHMAAPATAALDPAAVQAAAERARNIAAQASLFMGVGLLLSAFTAAVAAGIGGLRRDEMHETYWTEHATRRTPVA
jgi:hypothetical protein